MVVRHPKRRKPRRCMGAAMRLVGDAHVGSRPCRATFLQNRGMKRNYWVAGGVLGAVVRLRWRCGRCSVQGADARSAPPRVERGSLQASVAASGTLNPVALVTVGTQVSGQIREVYVDFNSEVKAAQLLAQIEPENLEYRLRAAQAELDAANAAGDDGAGRPDGSPGASGPSGGL